MKNATFIFLSLFLLLAMQAKATHTTGGEITYRCLGQGRYEFTVVVIRDCGVNTAPFNMNTIALRGPHGTATLPLVSAVDVSPRCANNTTLVCSSPATGLGIAGSQAQFTFRGIINLSALPPAPATNGYSFWVNLPCCRSNAINNSLASAGSQGLEAKLYRYTDPRTGQALSPAQLCDASPRFLQDQAAVFLNNPNDTIRMQHSGFDADAQDSLVYSVVPPLNEQRVPFAFTHPYSLNNPIPGLLGPQIPINPKNGEVVFSPNTLGSFIMPVQIKAYRQGQLISEVTREQVLRIVPYGAGMPPTIPPSIYAPFVQRAPQILPPVSVWSSQTGFNWEFYAGDTVHLNLRANDYFPTLTGDPLQPSTWVSVTNLIRLAVYGSMVSNNHVSATGCLLPPCATLRSITDPMFPAPSQNLPVSIALGNGINIGQGYNAAAELGAVFVWPTSCNSIPQIGDRTGFDFQVRLTALDTSCAVEGRSDATFTVRLRNLPLVPAPRLTKLAFDTASLRYTLYYAPNIDTSSTDVLDRDNFPHLSAAALKARSVNRRLASFQSYRIYRADGMQSPWVLVGATANPFDSVFVDTTLFTGSHQVFYQVVAVSGCGSGELGSNTLQATFNSTSVQDLAKHFNHVRLMPNPGRDVYRLQADEGHFLPSRWELRDMQGRLLATYNLQEGSASHELDLSSRATGIYLLHATEVGKAIRLVHQP